MQAGIVHNALGATDLAEAFARAGEIGFDGLEVFYSSAEDAALLSADGHAEALRGYARRAGVRIEGMAMAFLCGSRSLIGDAGQIEQTQTHVLQALMVAAEADCPMVMVPFFGQNLIETEDELQRAADALLDLADAAEASGVVLGVESTLNCHQEQSLLDHVGNSDFVKIYADTGNDTARKFDPPTNIRRLGPGALCGVHFKDVRLKAGEPPDYSVALGEGDVDFAAVVNALRAVNYDGWIVLETPKGQDPLASARANLAFTRELLNQTA